MHQHLLKYQALFLFLQNIFCVVLLFCRISFVLFCFLAQFFLFVRVSATCKRNLFDSVVFFLYTLLTDITCKSNKLVWVVIVTVLNDGYTDKDVVLILNSSFIYLSIYFYSDFHHCNL